MGSEQSRESSSAGGSAAPGGGSGRPFTRRPPPPTPTDRTGSPRPSISSDADLPYISYTVNRPIGESPKHAPGRTLRPSPRRLTRRPHTSAGARPPEVVVVREAPTNAHQDPDLHRLQSISPFLPIMRGALTAPTARDPEVLERISPGHLSLLARRYQGHLYAAALATAAQQDDLATAIKQIDASAATLVSVLTDRQRAYARHTKQVGHVTDVAHSIATCHATLNSLLDSLDSLNNSLPIPDRLEPFVWTTG